MNSKKLFTENDKPKKEIVGVKVKEIIKKFEEEIQKAKKEKEENRKLEEEKISKIMKEKNKIRRGLPAELLNELFGSLPLQNAFGLLSKMPNVNLARKIQKMLKSLKMTMMENKWNENDCGPKLAISEDGFGVTNFVDGDNWHCVRANFSIPAFNLGIKKPTIAFYCELEILTKIGHYSIHIGFCRKEFPLEGKCLGYRNNSIGIDRKGGFWADGYWIGFKCAEYEYIEEGDLIGIGIIHLPNSLMKCFATCNGQLIGIGKAELPKKFATHQLFPAVNLNRTGESIRTNFGKNEWLFKKFKHVLE